VTRSSTEAEIVGVHDVMPQLLWTAHFLGGQGINIEESILYQDNTSAILLEKNGRSSSTKRTRHMNVRYFFIKDHVDSRRVRIDHCPTAAMLADFFTKPLQGAQFRMLRDQIMNIDPSSAYHSRNTGHRSVLNPTSSSRPKAVDNDVTNGNGNGKTVDWRAGRDQRSYRDALLGKSKA